MKCLNTNFNQYIIFNDDSEQYPADEQNRLLTKEEEWSDEPDMIDIYQMMGQQLTDSGELIN